MKNHLPNKLFKRVLIAFRFLLFIVILQSLAGSQLLAANSNAQPKSIYDVKLDISMNDESVLNVFRKIEDRSDFTFSYNSKVISLEQKVSLDGISSLGKKLELIASQTDLAFKRINNNIHVFKRTREVEAVKEVISSMVAVTVSGTVVDETGNPLIGASIIEKGTSNGTVSDASGNYTLQVEEDATLVVSFIGYKTQQIQLNNRTVINVQLEVDIEALDEVVVIGYGSARKADLTGSTAGISASEIEEMPINSFEQSLQGRVTGVQVTQSNAAPGGGISMKIRGTNSISGNSEPLYVIDGVPIISNNAQATPGGIGGDGTQNNDFNALSTLNPNDIADIQVLKDASATAIYGARGANGVVIITTKKGKVGKPAISIDSYIGFQTPVKDIDQISADQFLIALNESADNANIVLPLDEDELNRLAANSIDYEELIMRSPSEATIRNLQLSVSGATDTDLNYFVSVNNFKQNGIVRTSGFERNSFRINLEKGFDRFRMGTNISFSRTDTDVVLAGNQISVPRYGISASPLQPIYDEDGEFLHTTILNGGNSANPEALLQGNTDNLLSDRLLGSIYAEYEILKSLKFRTTLGFDIDSRDREIYFDRNTGPRFGGRADPGWAQLATNSSTQLVTTNTLTYQPELPDQHTLTVTGVFEAQTFENSSFSIINRGFTSDALGAQAISSGTQQGGPTVANSAFKWQIASWVGRAFYSFQDKYLINVTVRHDGSSRFGRNTRWGTFPSVGLGWRISEESFLADVSFLDDLKLRGSYGITGNQEIGVLQTAERYVPTLGTLFGTTLASGVDAVSFANPNLGWEESAQTNIGLDASLFLARLNFTFDYYVRTTTDLLLAVNLAPSAGFPPPTFNAGEIENRGIEMALNVIPIENNNFQWNIGVNFSRNRNEVLQIVSDRTFGPGIQQNIPGSLIEPGLPIGVFFGYKTDGVYATQEEADSDVTDGSLFIKEAGEFRYVDVNGDNQINADDRTVIGDPNPDFTYGITTGLKYKNFSLDVIFQGVQGNDILWTDGGLLYRSEVGDRAVHQDRFDNRWTPENPNNAEYPKFNGNADDTAFDDRIIFDGSFFRLRNIVLGYDLPASVLEKINIQRLRFYVSATNLFTITDYPGWNPDINTIGQNSVNQGVDRSGYPLAKSFQMGFNITF